MTVSNATCVASSSTVQSKDEATVDDLANPTYNEILEVLTR